MKKSRITMISLCGAALFATSVYASEMSDTVHRKTMGGLHHSEQINDAEKSESSMSDAVHRKTMGGLKHKKQKGVMDEDEEAAVMSDGTHRKTMGGLSHPQK